VAASSITSFLNPADHRKHGLTIAGDGFQRPTSGMEAADANRPVAARPTQLSIRRRDAATQVDQVGLRLRATRTPIARRTGAYFTALRERVHHRVRR